MSTGLLLGSCVPESTGSGAPPEFPHPRELQEWGCEVVNSHIPESTRRLLLDSHIPESTQSWPKQEAALRDQGMIQVGAQSSPSPTHPSPLPFRFSKPCLSWPWTLCWVFPCNTAGGSSNFSKLRCPNPTPGDITPHPLHVCGNPRICVLASPGVFYCCSLS